MVELGFIWGTMLEFSLYFCSKKVADGMPLGRHSSFFGSDSKNHEIGVTNPFGFSLILKYISPKDFSEAHIYSP